MKKGFTLIEIIIALAILSGTLLVIGLFTLDISNFSIFYGQNLSAQQELQLSLRFMIREVRSMGPSNNGSYPIVSATANSVTFYSDSDKDGLFERIRYYMEGSVFKKAIIKPTGNPLVYNPAQENTFELVNNVINGNSVFDYYDKNYTGAESPLSFPVNIPLVKSLRATLTVDQNPLALPVPISFSITAMIRNFRQ